ncbi:MAG: tRNA uridine-5-carboxymethylaminomethyl(34) synthesis GTPase MnmE [Bacteroidales bacterium]|nr:tRNA uridine-5-carboxymethylaminomethyl(34) synthesis GTPase MnmE [Candidatus Physcousia equi]
MLNSDTICAPATAVGGAIAVIRISGTFAVSIANKIFSKEIGDAKGYSVHYGELIDNRDYLTDQDSGHRDPVIDDVLLTVFRAPHSYTGEDAVEISCHGSSYIIQTVLDLLIRNGARMARPGEFTQRAFLSGRLDLTQAEAVSDLIASQSKAAHQIAINQMRGNISNKLSELRNQLLTITSLLELELDFSEENVEFADRQQLHSLTKATHEEIKRLSSSFKSGNAIKNGIPVAIIGSPNVGKSTLLNRLLDDDKAIVSDIEGTTRDLIEDTITINGFHFRFIDTAGIRKTYDTIEQLGIERSLSTAKKAQIIILLTEPNVPYPELEFCKEQKVIYVMNKVDMNEVGDNVAKKCFFPCLHISALHNVGIELLQQRLLDHAKSLYNGMNNDEVLINNIRHKEALDLASSDLSRALSSIENRNSGDMIAEDLRLCLSHLSTILGTEITSEEVLINIFKNFCIGK